MEPIRHTLTAQIPFLRMYREDLDQLLLLFDRAGAKVTISDKQYRYDSLDDMKAHVGPRVVTIDIQAENPSVHFLLNQSKVIPDTPSPTVVYFNELRTEAISDEADNLFYRVRDFLLAHKAPRFRIPYLIPAIVAFVGCIVSIAVNHQLFTAQKVPLSFLVCMIATVGFITASVQNGNTLVLETRSNFPSFLAQNKNGIIMLLIGAFIGIAGTIIGQWLTRLLFK
jgi:hypothetical protein